MSDLDTKTPQEAVGWQTAEASDKPILKPRRETSRTVTVAVWRVIVVVVVIAAWQWLPDIPGIRHVLPFLDPFFISSPWNCAKQVWALMTGAHGATLIWGPLAQTVITALVGAFAALCIGAVAGLAVTNWETLSRVTKPFLIVLNAVPRVAIVPIIVLISAGQNEADALTAFGTVFFLAFYNAAEGAQTVPIEIIRNAELLGASKFRMMWQVRWPFALAWTLATLPNAIAFGLTGTVTAEIFTGGSGLGYQIVLGLDNSNADQLFAIVVITAAVGVILVLSSGLLRKQLLPWWETN